MESKRGSQSRASVTDQANVAITNAATKVQEAINNSGTALQQFLEAAEERKNAREKAARDKEKKGILDPIKLRVINRDRATNNEAGTSEIDPLLTNTNENKGAATNFFNNVSDAAEQAAKKIQKTLNKGLKDAKTAAKTAVGIPTMSTSELVKKDDLIIELNALLAFIYHEKRTDKPTHELIINFNKALNDIETNAGAMQILRSRKLLDHTGNEILEINPRDMKFIDDSRVKINELYQKIVKNKDASSEYDRLRGTRKDQQDDKKREVDQINELARANTEKEAKIIRTEKGAIDRLIATDPIMPQLLEQIKYIESKRDALKLEEKELNTKRQAVIEANNGNTDLSKMAAVEKIKNSLASISEYAAQLKLKSDMVTDKITTRKRAIRDDAEENSYSSQVKGMLTDIAERVGVLNLFRADETIEEMVNRMKVQPTMIERDSQDYDFIDQVIKDRQNDDKQYLERAQEELYNTLKDLIKDHAVWNKEIKFMGGQTIIIDAASNTKKRVPTGIEKMIRCLAGEKESQTPTTKKSRYSSMFRSPALIAINKIDSVRADANEILTQIKVIRVIAEGRLEKKSKNDKSEVSDFYKLIKDIKDGDLTDTTKLRGHINKIEGQHQKLLAKSAVKPEPPKHSASPNPTS